MNRLGMGKMMRKRSRKLFQKNVLILFCFMLLFSPFSTAFGDIVEDDSPEEATEITNLTELNEIRNDLDSNYRLGADIDLSEVADWEAIGSEDKPFNGAFDGSGYTINGMDIAFEEAEHSGLFVAVSDDASVENLVVEFREGVVVVDAEIIETEEVISEEDDEGDSPEEEKEGDDPVLEDEEEPAIALFDGIQPFADGDFAGGDGSIDDPYLIETAEQLDKVRGNLTKHFKLKADIDLDVAPYNVDEGWEPIGEWRPAFEGSFDGNDYTITGLKIDSQLATAVGLFSHISDAHLKNITLEDVDVKGQHGVGALVGRVMGGTIESSSVSGTVNGEDDVGGLVGLSSYSIILDSSSTANVEGKQEVGGLVGEMIGEIKGSHATGQVKGEESVGGLTGTMNGNITKSYATGNVTGSFNLIGGLIGRHIEGAVQDTYASGDVSGFTKVGGLIGDSIYKGWIRTSYASGSVIATQANPEVGGLIGKVGDEIDIIVSDSYYDKDMTGQNDIGKGIPKTTAEMKTKTTFSTWNFINTWKLPMGEYPRLLKKGEAGDPPDVPKTIYVKENSNGDGTSWTSAFGDLQTALEKAVKGDEIWIAAGTYLPTKNIGGNDNPTEPKTKTFQMKNGVVIYGGFSGTNANETVANRNYEAHKTILSGDLGVRGDKGDNAYHVFYHPVGTNLDATAVLDGVTISDGNASVSDPNSWDRNGLGGGMYNVESSPTLTNVVIRDNHAIGEGGGIFNEDSSSTLTNVSISNNIAEGDGGAMYNFYSPVKLTNVQIIDNEAEDGGGLANSSSNVILTNVLISRNTAIQDGGGINNDDSNPTLTNVTISGNKAVDGGGIFNEYDSSPTINNSIIWGNSTAIEKSYGYDNEPDISYSLVEGSGGSGADWEVDFGIDGGNNLDVNPKFVAGSYQLADDSPAIDMGNNNFVPAGITIDLAGNERIFGATVDMGAYEFGGTPPPVPGGDVTAIYVDEAGDKLAEPVVKTGNVGENYTTVAKTIAGYTLKEVPTNQNGRFTADSQEVKYVYTKNPVVEADKEIIGSHSLGTMFDVGAKELAEILLLLPNKVTVTLDDGTEEKLNVSKWDADSVPVYDKDTARMYTFSGDIELPNGIANSDGIRAKFSVSLNDIAGPDPGDTDKEIAVPYYDGVPLKVGIYEQADLPLPKKVKVQLDDGSYLELEVDWHVNSNPVYDKNTAGGYLFSGEFKLIDGVANPHGHLAYRHFTLSEDDKPTPEPSVVIVTHVDEGGKELVPGKIVTGAEGEAYKTEAEEIEGYTFIKVNGNESGTFTNETLFVEYVYEKDSDPIDPDKDKEIMNVPVIGTTVGVGTEDLADIISRFPSTVEVTLDDGTVVEVGVKWNEISKPAYDKNKVGAYIFSGEFILTEGIVNTANHMMTYQVNVFDYDEAVPTDPMNPTDEGSENLEDPKVTVDSDAVDVIITTDDSSTKLPKTATPYYTIMFAGFLLMVVGGAIYFMIRKKRLI